jgi:hypothetical protein
VIEATIHVSVVVRDIGDIQVSAFMLASGVFLQGSSLAYQTIQISSLVGLSHFLAHNYSFVIRAGRQVQA